VRPVILSPEEYFVELEVLDVFKQFYDILTKFALSLSSNMAKRVMPGKLGLYLIYIMAGGQKEKEMMDQSMVKYN
jgi:hypothetical protein